MKKREQPLASRTRYNTVKSKLDLIGEITVDNVVNCLIFRLDIKLNSLDLLALFPPVM